MTDAGGTNIVSMQSTLEFEKESYCQQERRRRSLNCVIHGALVLLFSDAS